MAAGGGAGVVKQGSGQPAQPYLQLPLPSLMPGLVAGLGGLPPPDAEHQVPPAHSPPSLSPISPTCLPPLLLSLTSFPLPQHLFFFPFPSLFRIFFFFLPFFFFPFQGFSPLLASPTLSLPMPSSLRVLPATGHGTRSEDTEKQPG